MKPGELRSGTALAQWCGWVLIGCLALTPLLGWLSPMGFAAQLGVIGLLTLPAIRVADEDRSVAVLLLLALIWAAVSMSWSPYQPSKPSGNGALKQALCMPLFWAAVCAARRADPRLKRVALAVLAWGLALLGVLLLVEFATDARFFETLHVTYYEPIRHDLARVKMAHSSFVLALLWPIGFAAAVKSKTRFMLWLPLPMMLGTVAAAARFGADAPVLAVALVVLTGLAVFRWPNGGPRVLAGAAGMYMLAAPLLILAVRATGQYAEIQQKISLSWSIRMGYWSRAVDWLSDHPFRGWGLDASRMFSPGIQLHPHNGALQIWMELGAPGALLAAAFWWTALSRLARSKRDIGASAVAASAAVYLLFGAVNFGVWQEWWLALGALIAVAAGLLAPPPAAQPST